MKNFTKQILNKTLYKPTRWLLIAFMFLLGTGGAWAWTVYYDNSATKWSTVYLVIGHDSYRRGNYTMTKVSGYDNLYSYTATDWTDAKYVAFSSTSIAASSSSLTGLGIPYYIFDANMTNANNKIFGGTAYVSDKAQLVLNDYIGFYIGEPTSWNQSRFFIWKTENSKNSYQAGGNTAETQGSNKLQIVYAKSGTYSLTHSASWAGVSTGAVKAGYGYYIGDGNAMKTLTPSTAPSYTFKLQTPISQGSTSTVSSETGTGKSMYGTKTVALDSYYIQKSGESTFTKITKSGSALQTQNLAVGTYQVVPVVYDGKIYFKGTPQTLVIEEACEAPDEPTATVEQHTTKCNNTDREQGIITLTNYNPDYTYKLGDDEVSVSDDGKISGLAAGKYYITAVNSCTETKTTSTYDVNTTDVTPTGSVSISGNSPICSGEKATLTANVTSTKGEIVSYSWSPSNGTKNDNKYTTPALTQNTSYLGQVKLEYEGCEKTFSATSYTVVVNTAPTKPAITLIPDNGNIVAGNSATLSVNNPVDGYTYTLYETTRGEIESGMTSFTISDAGNYYVKATNDCQQESPASEEKEITVCTIGSTLNSAEYDAATQKVSLEGAFEVCSVKSYYGFQWKKAGSGWCEENKPTSTSAYITIGQQATEGGTKSSEYTIEDQNSAYVFRTYVVPVGGAWIYGNEITVTPCITVATPNVTAEAICLGEEAILTLSNKQDNVVYKLDGVEIFKIGNTHTVNPDRTTTYTITATSTISCEVNQTATTTVQVEVKDLPEPPAISSGTTVCPNTQFTLPTIDGKWYAQAEGGAPYGSTTISGITVTTNYYAEAVKYGCSSATRTKYTVNVHTAPVAPVITLNPATVGQDKPSVLSISIETYNPSNTKYELYKGNAIVGEMATQTTEVSSSDVGSVNYSVKATHKECADLTSTSNTVTLTVQEAGAIIAALGDLKVDPQDPVDFVAMYVKNDGLSDYTDKGATKVTGYTWQFSSDGGKNWTPCVSTATIGVTNGSDKCNNFRPSAEGKYRCKVTYDVGEQTSNVLTVTGDGNTAKTFKDVTMNIPVISVNTGKGNFPTCDGLSGTASKNADVIKEKISVDVKIFNTDGTVYYDRKARMNYRGSSSLNFVKKSYAFCTAKEKTKDDKGAVDTGKENLFGLSNGAKDKDWVLYAAAADPSIMRNRLMFDTFRDMTGGWSVNSMYVELVINGEYKGVYVLMDKITANEKRVNVSWNLDKQGNTTQEGFIVKFDKTDIADRYENTSGDQKTFKSTYSGHDGFETYDTDIDQRFEIEYPEKEDIEEEDLEKGQQAGDWSVVFNSIKDKFNKFEKELKDGNFSEVQKIIDYQSWADWFIITEFGKNIDGYRASNLFVYDGSKPNAKIEARPLWDQELSFDNHCPNYYASYGANSEEGLIVENSEGFNNDASTPFWFTGKYKGGRGTYNGSNQTFKGLLDDPCFVAMVKTRWETHKANALSESKLNAKLEAYTTEMGAAKDREATFWSTRSRETCQCSYSGSTGYDDVSFTDSKKAITDWIGKRPAGLTTAINALKGLDLTISLTVTPDGGITTPWEAVMVQVNNPSGYDYDFEYTTNSLDQVEGVIILESNDKYTYRIPRPENWGYGDDIRTGVEYGIQATLKVDDAGSQCGSDIDDSLTKATATITLVDEENDNCNIK